MEIKLCILTRISYRVYKVEWYKPQKIITIYLFFMSCQQVKIDCKNSESIKFNKHHPLLYNLLKTICTLAKNILPSTILSKLFHMDETEEK